MELLESLDDRGLPFEYLLSRIRGRRSKLIKDWRTVIANIDALEYQYPERYRGLVIEKSPEGVWKLLVREYRWVYTQMNDKLRDVFGQFFVYAELRTLFICLRHLRKVTTAKTNELLGTSLMSHAIKVVLATSEDIPSAVAGLEKIFLSQSDRFIGLTETLGAGGLRDVEQQLTYSFLSYTMDVKLHPLMKLFFVLIIDARNIMSLYKYIRMNATTIPSFSPAGSIEVSRLRDIMVKKDMVRVGSLIRDFSRMKLELFSPSQAEQALYRGITRRLREKGRDPLDVGLILDYLWRCSIEAMNLGVLLHGKGLERDIIAAEMIT